MSEQLPSLSALLAEQTDLAQRQQRRAEKAEAERKRAIDALRAILNCSASPFKETALASIQRFARAALVKLGEQP